MAGKIRVAMLDDHQLILDGIYFRLKEVPEIEMVAMIHYGDELEPMLEENQVDILILDISVPMSADDTKPYPILHILPELTQKYPDMEILILSMHAQRTLIQSVMDLGASGYILKEDSSSIHNIVTVIQAVSHGSIHMSPLAYQLLRKRENNGEYSLTQRQIQALSLCASFPGLRTVDLARKMNVQPSTMRNLLSSIYIKLGVDNRLSAITKARQLGILPTDLPPIP